MSDSSDSDDSDCMDCMDCIHKNIVFTIKNKKSSPDSMGKNHLTPRINIEKQREYEKLKEEHFKILKEFKEKYILYKDLLEYSVNSLSQKNEMCFQYYQMQRHYAMFKRENEILKENNKRLQNQIENLIFRLQEYDMNKLQKATVVPKPDIWGIRKSDASLAINLESEEEIIF